jgi:hypothetical protein
MITLSPFPTYLNLKRRITILPIPQSDRRDEIKKALKKNDGALPAYPPELLTARRAAFIAQIKTSSPAANRTGQASE